MGKEHGLGCRLPGPAGRLPVFGRRCGRVVGWALLLLAAAAGLGTAQAPGSRLPDVERAAPTGGGTRLPAVPTFLAVHCEASSANPGNWAALQRFVILAERYGARLTLMLNPQWAQFALADTARMDDVTAWQRAGHEIALHYHTIRHGDWCGYTNRAELRSDPRYRGTVAEMMALLRKLAAPNPVVTACCGIDIASTALPASTAPESLIDPVDFPQEILYDVDGIRDGLVTPFAFSFAGRERLHLRHHFLNPRRPESLGEIQEELRRAQPGQVMGVVTHEQDFAAAPGLIEAWLRFATDGGVGIRTVRDIASGVFKPAPGNGFPAASGASGLAGAPPPDAPFGFHPATVPPDVAGGDRWACAREIGVRWHRPEVYAFWFLCQEQREDGTYGGFQWERLDSFVRDVPRSVSVVWNLSARNRTPQDTFLPADLDAYRRYVRAVVERYDGDGVEDAPGCPRISHWQVENEPSFDLRQRGASPESYAALLEATYQAAKEADPTCTLLIGGMSGVMLHGMDELGEFYAPVLRRLHGKGFDVFDCHWFGSARGDYREFGNVHRQVRALLDENRFRQAPIWMLECGTYSGQPRMAHLLSWQSEEEQASDLVRRYVYALSLGVEKVFWAFGLAEGFGQADGDFFDGTGLVCDGLGPDDRGRGTRKPAYHAYRLMADKLVGKPFAGSVKGLPRETFAYRFGRGREEILVVWRDWWGEPDVASRSVALPFRGDAVVTTSVPDAWCRFHSWTAHAAQGALRLDVPRAPLYVEQRRDGGHLSRAGR